MKQAQCTKVNGSVENNNKKPAAATVESAVFVYIFVRGKYGEFVLQAEL